MEKDKARWEARKCSDNFRPDGSREVVRRCGHHHRSQRTASACAARLNGWGGKLTSEMERYFGNVGPGDGLYFAARVDATQHSTSALDD